MLYVNPLQIIYFKTLQIIYNQSLQIIYNQSLQIIYNQSLQIKPICFPLNIGDWENRYFTMPEKW